MFRSTPIVIVLAVVGVAACGDDNASVPLATPGPTSPSPSTSEPGPTDTTPTPSTVPATTVSTPTETAGTEAGLGVQVPLPGELPATGSSALTGVVRLLRNGCFMLDFDGEQRFVTFPAGFAGAPDDSTSLIGPDGWTIGDGTAIDATGQLMSVEMIPGGTDGRLGNFLAFCDPGSAEIAVLATAEPAFDPATLTTDELVGMLTGADFTQSWACGYGFAASTADQRVGLVMYADSAPSGSSTVTLPDAAWRAEVLVGKHLFAQSCDDVIEFWEPESIITASWPLSAGTFELALPDTDVPGCSANDVATVLVGAVVETPVGRIDLPDLSLTNSAWGCFAG